MASGFIILPDGRCFARRWDVYDYVLRAIINELKIDSEQQELYLWLQSMLPGPNDIDELGYGAWLRVIDQESIARFLDMRQLSKSDQDAIVHAANKARRSSQNPDGFTRCLNEFEAMVAAYQRGDPPLSNSDWTTVKPASTEHIGPGWKRDVPPSRPKH